MMISGLTLITPISFLDIDQYDNLPGMDSITHNLAIPNHKIPQRTKRIAGRAKLKPTLKDLMVGCALCGAVTLIRTLDKSVIEYVRM